jgi:phosphatidylglycerol lysyltransferase
MGRFDPARLKHEWLVVAQHPDTGRVEAFLTWVPIWGRHGWALDLMRRRRDATPGTMELLIARSAENARERGDEMLSLSLSALARAEDASTPRGAAGAAPDRTQAPGGSEPSPALHAAGWADRHHPGTALESDRAREFLIQHLARFYDFEGLFRFKRKFDPQFEPRYLVYPSPFALPQVTLALIRAQTPGGLTSYFRKPPREGPRSIAPTRAEPLHATAE